MRFSVLIFLLIWSKSVFGQIAFKERQVIFLEGLRGYLVEKEMEMPNEITQKIFLGFDSSVNIIGQKNKFLVNKIYEQKNVNFLIKEYLTQYEELNEIEPTIKSFKPFEVLIRELVEKDFDFERTTGEKAFGLLGDFMSDYANLLIEIDPKNPVEIFLNNEKVQLNNPLPKLYFDIVVHAGKAYDVKIKAKNKEYEQKRIVLKAEEKKLIKYHL